MPALLDAAGGAARPGAWPPPHLFRQGLHPADDALPRLLRLLHVPQRSRASPARFTMAPGRGLAAREAGERLGAKEALFSLGDKPEALFPEHRAFLRRHGHRTTLGYLAPCARAWSSETGLLPHANPGLMSERDLAALREVNVSMGIMLENVSERLLGPGAAARSRARQGAGAPARDDRARGQARHPVHHRHPDRHRRDARRARGLAPRHPRAPRAVRPHPGGHRPELPRQARDPDARTRPSPTRTICCARWRSRACCSAPR